MGGENEVRWSEAGAGSGLAITIHFTWLVTRGKLARRAKMDCCPKKT